MVRNSVNPVSQVSAFVHLCRK